MVCGANARAARLRLGASRRRTRAHPCGARDATHKEPPLGARESVRATAGGTRGTERRRRGGGGAGVSRGALATEHGGAVACVATMRVGLERVVSQVRDLKWDNTV